MSITSTGNSMSQEALWEWLANTELSFQIGATWWFPLLESIHVLSIVMLVGTILMVDVRLLGLAGQRNSLASFVSELTPWSWAALLPAVVTGLGLFISRPDAYAANPAMQIKMLLLIIAGLNVLYFHKFVYRRVEQARSHAICGAVSLLLWVGILLAGRWVGHIN